VGFVVDKMALGHVFSEYFDFPCQSSFHHLLHNHHHLSSGAGIIGQQWPTYQVDSVSDIRKHKVRVLRRIFGPKRDEVIGGCRKLHNEELHNLQRTPSIITINKTRRMRRRGGGGRREIHIGF
jgi:hypothetical protein